MADPVTPYHIMAAAFAEQYEAVSPEIVHASFAALVTGDQQGGQQPTALDIGAGSGRDAAWLAKLGYDVIAVEPAAGMRTEGQRRHPSSNITWLDDRLPDLQAVHRLGVSADVILLSAVWMHVPPHDRARAFRKLVTLLKPGGQLLMSLREGPTEPDRPMWPAPLGEVEGLARAFGLSVTRATEAEDRLGRQDVRWTSVALRLPDDGAGALPLLRGIILNDGKSSSYKLGLLRAIARVADVAPGLARARLDEDAVDLPLGLVALNWIRMYLPLVRGGLPQAPNNVGPDGLGFAKQGFRALLADNLSGQDLRIGARFIGERALALTRALAETARLIAAMPANFTRYPNSSARVFGVTLGSIPRAVHEADVGAPLLSGYGTLTVPGSVWRALQRLGAWVEPVLVTEWTRLIKGYADRMGRATAPGEIEEALVWLEPRRDTQLARNTALRMLEQGRRIDCVWTGARLGPGSLDIDHCLPWSAWPCGDLWNLLPASPRVNQHQKRDRLPSAAALGTAKGQIIAWWEQAWLDDAALRGRFEREVAAALPMADGAAVEDVFSALEWRRRRLRQDQQVEEWSGAPGRPTVRRTASSTEPQPIG